MYNQLLSFATAENLIIPGETKVFTMYQDNPFITDAKNLRASVAMTIPSDIVLNKAGDIDVLQISGKSDMVILKFRLWNMKRHGSICIRSGYLKRDEKAKDSFIFEIYVTEPPKQLKEKSLTDIFNPIE